MPSTEDSKLACLHVGLVVNPLAGLGGSLAMKGSDGEELRSRIKDLSQEQRARSQQRVKRALENLVSLEGVRFSTWCGSMGESVVRDLDVSANILGSPTQEKLTSSEDTRAAVAGLVAADIDILVFAGGDGTARDVYDVVGDTLPVLGIPAGVKMHSGVFAVSPEAAGELLERLAKGGLVGLQLREVRDIDEDAFRHDVVRARFYGEMLVPTEGHYLQQTKIGGRESHELVAADIAEWLSETLNPAVTYFMGPGSTTAAIMENLNLANTLLGVDVIRDGTLLASDVDEQQLLAIVDEAPNGCEIIVTAIGGQGHVFGRGNQQFSPAVIRRVGIENITIVATKGKIAALNGRPLLVDTNDPSLDHDLSGLKTVTTGYDDRVLYRVGDGQST
ncbi:MAG: ATP-NAD kinase family protein [Halioglobus sp.]